MTEQIAEILQSVVRESVAVIVDSSLNVCKEVFKFTIILLILYYFALRSFQFLDDILLTIQVPDEFVLASGKEYNVGPELDVMTHQIIGETSLRIGAPNENLINQRADLLEQLEIEAEYEENLNNLIKSEEGSENSVFKDVHPAVLNTRSSDEIAPFNDLFIAQIKREPNETSRPSQTIKTSLGKKSKVRETNEDAATTSTNAYSDQEKDEELLKIFKMERVSEFNEELAADPNASSVSEEQRTSYDEQSDHESFNRV